MRKFFITDLHGEYKGFEQLLSHVHFQPTTDQLVIGGDLVSRGPDSGPVLKKVRSLQQAHPEHIKVIIGNHEEMMRWHYQKKEGSDGKLWMMHGGKEAEKSFSRTFKSKADLDEHLEWAYNLPLLYEDDEFIYTHAGLDPKRPLNMQSREIIWMEESDFYAYSVEELLECTGNKPIVHGHTPVEFTWLDGARLNCDLGSHTYTVEEDRGLGLFDLTNLEYYVYKAYSGEIQKRDIPRL